MLENLPHKFRAYGLDADVRTLLVLRKAMQKGLVKTLGDLYNVLKGIVVKEPSMLAPFTRAYYQYFLNIDIQNGDRLDDAIERSETFQNWLEDMFEKDPKYKDLEMEELVNMFLDQVHLTTYDIKEIISGKEIFDKDDPNLSDEDATSSEETTRNLLDKMADYSELSLEELLERMEEVLKNQKGKHSGGSHWIGTGGISPYGHGGAAKNGIRVGGTGGGKMARRVIGDRNYYPVDMDSLLNDNNVDAALASLKGIIEDSAHDRLDVENTIKNGLKRGGLFIPELENIKDEKLQVMLLIDNGGYSMSGYIRIVQELFRKMKTRFAHDLKVFYFHNIIYDEIFTDAKRTKSISVKRFLKHDPNYKVFIIGDAAMSPYELNKWSIESLQAMDKKFKNLVWLNPEPYRYWASTYTTAVIRKLVDMYQLTPRGIEKAVRDMNSKTRNR